MNIKRGIHHIQHTRPQWYKDYHQWEHHATLHWITFIVSCVVILIGFFNVATQLTQKTSVQPVHAATNATQTVTQAVTAGSLSLTSGGNQSMSSEAVSFNNQTSTGSLGTITVDDNRGSGAGWTATATSNEFAYINSPVTTGGSDPLSIDSSATYASGSAGTYTITVTSGGLASSGTDTVSVSGLETISSVTIPTTGITTIGTGGLVVDFTPSTSYTTSDSWTIRMDVIPVTGFKITPSAATANAGLLTGVTTGGAHTFSSTTDQATIMSAASGDGLGEYVSTPAASLVVPANSYANTYTATVTETVQ